jgi:hypothetical protein
MGENLEILQKVWDWAKEKLTTGELNKFLLATDKEGKTGCHFATMREKLETLQKEWEWAEKNNSRGNK